MKLPYFTLNLLYNITENEIPICMQTSRGLLSHCINHNDHQFHINLAVRPLVDVCHSRERYPSKHCWLCNSDDILTCIAVDILLPVCTDYWYENKLEIYIEQYTKSEAHNTNAIVTEIHLYYKGDVRYRGRPMVPF